jgi:putative transposase
LIRTSWIGPGASQAYSRSKAVVLKPARARRCVHQGFLKGKGVFEKFSFDSIAEWKDFQTNIDEQTYSWLEWQAYPSEKMGVTIQFESHRVELAGIFEMEHDPDVRQYFDQPEPIKLNYASAKGKRLGIHHTPDFFVIRTSCAGWEEWKTEEELETLSKSNPHRYCKDSSGGWICPPGKELAESLGLYYRVRSSSEINEKYIRNITFLEDYLLESTPNISQEDRDSLLSISEGLPGIELLELIRVVESSISRDIVYGAIARGVIYVDLYAALLVEPLRVKVYPSQEFAASHNQSVPRGGKLLSLHSGSCVVWDARTWTVANIGETSVALVSSDQRMTELSLLAFEALIRDHKVSVITTDEATESGGDSPSKLMKASKEHLEVALNRLDEVNTYLRDPMIALFLCLVQILTRSGMTSVPQFGRQGKL